METWEWRRAEGGHGPALSLSSHPYWASSPVLPGHFPCYVQRNPMPPEDGLWREKHLGILCWLSTRADEVVPLCPRDTGLCRHQKMPSPRCIESARWASSASSMWKPSGLCNTEHNAKSASNVFMLNLKCLFYFLICVAMGVQRPQRTCGGQVCKGHSTLVEARRQLVRVSPLLLPLPTGPAAGHLASLSTLHI